MSTRPRFPASALHALPFPPACRLCLPACLRRTPAWMQRFRFSFDTPARPPRAPRMPVTAAATLREATGCCSGMAAQDTKEGRPWTERDTHARQRRRTTQRALRTTLADRLTDRRLARGRGGTSVLCSRQAYFLVFVSSLSLSVFLSHPPFPPARSYPLPFPLRPSLCSHRSDLATTTD